MRFYFVTIVAAILISGCGKGEQGASKVEEASQPIAVEPTAPPKVPQAKHTAGPWDGPFGLQMGLKDEELKAAMPDMKPIGDNIYITEKPPKVHEAFDKYLLLTSPNTGLCKISASGVDIKTSQFGDELRSSFENIKSALTERYGKPTDDYSYLKHGSLWNEPRDWMMGLLKKDRVLAAVWQVKSNKKPKGADLPNNLDNILIDVTASGTDSGYIAVRYAFTNEDECLGAAKREKNKAL